MTSEYAKWLIIAVLITGDSLVNNYCHLSRLTVIAGRGGQNMCYDVASTLAAFQLPSVGALVGDVSGAPAQRPQLLGVHGDEQGLPRGLRTSTAPGRLRQGGT